MLADVQWLVLIALVTGVLLYRSAVRRKAQDRRSQTSPDGSASSQQPDPYGILAMDGSGPARTRDRRAADDRADGDRANDSSDGDGGGGDGGGD